MMHTDESDDHLTDAKLFAQQRSEMVERQLRRRGLKDERVLHAMLTVPREEFVPAGLRDSAYDDCALPIGHGQTISQPFTVAFMIEALQLRGDERVLEIGTGSGYAAAVLSLVAREVYTIERIPELAAAAADRLERLGYRNVHVKVADGTLGLPEAAPFDGIIVTAGAPELPTPYREQLAPGGRIVIPIGDSPRSQLMYRYTRENGTFTSECLGGFAFVPLVGQHGWEEESAQWQ